VVLRAKQTTLAPSYSFEHQTGFILIAPYACATCVGHFSGHHQACQYNSHQKEDIMK